jgi:flagellar biosynthesis protein FliQ
MNVEIAVDLARQATMLTILLSAPLMLLALAVGLAISVLQAVTQIQEQTVQFVPKLVLMLGAMVLLLPWSLSRLIEYSTTLIREIPNRM